MTKKADVDFEENVLLGAGALGSENREQGGGESGGHLISLGVTLDQMGTQKRAFEAQKTSSWYFSQRKTLNPGQFLSNSPKV